MENFSSSNSSSPEKVHNTPEIIFNEDREILAPNGLRSHFENPNLARMVRSEDFLEWFGDWTKGDMDSSKATHPDTNEPILFTHRSNVILKPGENLSVEHDKTFGEKHGLPQKAVYFTTANLQEYGKYEYHAFLKLKEPASEWGEIEENQDGCLLRGQGKDGSEWFHAAVFSDDQIFLVE